MAVVSVVPAEGVTAPLNEDVTVTYATGESVVPVLTGRIREQAESDAKAVGFDVRFKTKRSDQAAGIVIDQDPEPGTKLPRGTKIVLTVAKAKPAPKPTQAPPTTSAPTTSPPSSPAPPPSESPSSSPSPSDGSASPGG